jgi:iron-sulfur cluster assembly protein
MPIGAIVKQVAAESLKTSNASSRLRLRKAALTLVRDFNHSSSFAN